MAFVPVCKTSDVPLGNIRAFKANDKDIAIANVEGKFYCINGRCTHKGGPLGEGELDGITVTCPWHGGQFDVTTGKVLSPPAPTAVSCFKLKVEGGQILVDA
ncbi:non-heme iron oxygenase ferredoxin subunit [Candidatus Woesearchaeota archaeon]|nr:non-heme iron oxygenase ferredoxin subunit [Candidatus Woesearchaeota archaeon]